jgi:hypothetical protein
MSIVGKFIAFTFADLLVANIVEDRERHIKYTQSREYADQVGKPLLVVGAPKRNWPSHPGGDVTIDLDPNVDSLYHYEVADVRDIPYPNQYFGAALCSHVLEHLGTKEDAIIAMNELYRVAECVFICSPRKYNIYAWVHPQHHLWITEKPNGYYIEQR